MKTFAMLGLVLYAGSALAAAPNIYFFARTGMHPSGCMECRQTITPAYGTLPYYTDPVDGKKYMKGRVCSTGAKGEVTGCADITPLDGGQPGVTFGDTSLMLAGIANGVAEAYDFCVGADERQRATTQTLSSVPCEIEDALKSRKAQSAWAHATACWKGPKTVMNDAGAKLSTAKFAGLSLPFSISHYVALAYKGAQDLTVGFHSAAWPFDSLGNSCATCARAMGAIHVENKSGANAFFDGERIYLAPRTSIYRPLFVKSNTPTIASGWTKGAVAASVFVADRDFYVVQEPGGKFAVVSLAQSACQTTAACKEYALGGPCMCTGGGSKNAAAMGDGLDWPYPIRK